MINYSSASKLRIETSRMQQVKDTILETQWKVKGHTNEPQGNKKGVGALIDAGVETLTSIVKHLKVRVCAPGFIGGGVV
jgi:hypothetical protein